jgi:FMN phosphatase YigB (HAD superfamily)
MFFDVDGVLVHGHHARPEKRRRWEAAIRAGFDFVQTDEYEELAALIKQHQAKAPETTKTPY